MQTKIKIVSPKLKIVRRRGREYTYWEIDTTVNAPYKYIVMPLYVYRELLQIYDDYLVLKDYILRLLSWIETEYKMRIDKLKETLEFIISKIKQSKNEKEKDRWVFLAEIYSMELKSYQKLLEEVEKIKEKVFSLKHQ